MLKTKSSCKFVLIIAFLIAAATVDAQYTKKIFLPDDFTPQQYAVLKQTLGKNKNIPGLYEKQILIALSYFPELRNTFITFKIRHAYSPLETKLEWLSATHTSKNKRFTVAISDSSISKLSPILFDKLDFNAQIGVIGHELSHVVDFSSRNIVGLAQIGIRYISPYYVDRFEYRTDSICIAHGLGYQLLAWSGFVRNALHLQNWEGADNINAAVTKRERYMNPSTILTRIQSSKVYQEKSL